ncbi:DNA primase [Oscillatoria sp. FACHB-1406]|nr:DNA primase [Oscillatoria sp. FACHB-1406]MBD2579483.1 DNA primase [Oscillatoria sp. FACHB-1406]
MDIPRLHPDTIDEIKQRVDIVDVVQEYVPLRKRGKDFVGLCPFHQEKSPSFSVTPSKQVYYCFGCNAGGNAINFLMEIGKSSFADVLLDLARRYQIPIRTVEREQHEELQRQLSLREQLYEILAIAANFFQHALRQPQGATALTYLKETRQLSEATIQQFGLGYAPAGWETLYRYLVETKRLSVALVEQAGLIKKRSNGEGYIDYFRDRVTVPISDIQGRIIGFGSRVLGDELPKYLNSPETELFDKGKILYALDKAKGAIAKQDSAIVVEGYFDAIALHGCGIENAVASLGTAFNQERVKQLLRYTDSKQVIFNFDADAAGMKATQRAIAEIESLIYSGQIQLRVLNLPDGKDADEFLNSSPEAPDIYRQQLQNAPLWIDWQIVQLVSGEDLTQSDRFEKIVPSMVKLLQQIPDNARRTHYLHRCGEILSQGDSRLTARYEQDLNIALRKLRKKGDKEKPPTANIQQLKAERDLLERAESLLLCIYIHCPQYRDTIAQTLDDKDLIFSVPHYRFLWRKLLEMREAEGSRDLLSQLHAIGIQYPQEMAKVSHLLQLDETAREDIAREPLIVSTAIAGLERVTYEKYRRYCIERWQQLDPSKDAEAMQSYYQQLQAAENTIQALDRERHVSLFDLYGATVRYN